MPGLVPGIHALLCGNKGVDGRDIGVRSTPSFGRLCPAMTWRKRRPSPFEARKSAHLRVTD